MPRFPICKFFFVDGNERAVNCIQHLVGLINCSVDSPHRWTRKFTCFFLGPRYLSFSLWMFFFFAAPDLVH